MRLRTRTWALISIGAFIAAAVFWRMGDQRMAERRPAPGTPATVQSNTPVPSAQTVAPVVSPAYLVATAEDSGVTANAPSEERSEEFPFRLSNSAQTVGQLTRNDKALLLRNALIDTAAGKPVAIPQALRAQADPGSYIVQSRGVLSDGFRRQVEGAKGEIISYVPNNAYLVRVGADGAREIAGMPQTQAVLPYEPYYKLDGAVLPHAVENKPLAAGTKLRVTLFPGQRETAIKQFEQLGARIVGEDRSPFGPELIVQPAPKGNLAVFAQLTSVQNLEFAPDRVAANDLTRVRTQVSADPVTPNNYLNLSGTNVYININDTGVDAGHPDLTNRVIIGAFTNDKDTNGHGTHVAGVIASSGENGPVPGTNAVGSVDNASFRGMAHGATLLSFDVFNDILADWELQDAIARTNLFHFGKTNALISNNSWGYRNAFGYNSAAASYDAAVRDSIPGLLGPQPVLFVFAAGNSGAGDENGSGGFPDTVTSPGTAKNVITVGAIENFRNITNEVTRTNDGGGVITNQAFRPSTDSSNQVLWSSSRGNVGVGIEGDFGRFKPDVVAPGSYIVSTRSSQWDTNSYYNPTNISVAVYTNLVLGADETNYFSIFIPRNAVAFSLEVLPNAFSPAVIPPVGIFASTDYQPSLNPGDFRGTNFVYLDPSSAGWAKNTDWFYDLVNTNAATFTYDLRTVIFFTNNLGNLMQKLDELNEALLGTNPPPKYRYESGTSLAAPVVSGMLGLLQEYFETRVNPPMSNASPAIMKALLINSARSVGPLYDLQVRNNINYQGWGLPSLTRLLPATNQTGSPILLFDQSPTNALATGEEYKREVLISPDAQSTALRVSLVWTDPPGNPAVGVKLVNDLDLVVTNMDTGDIYFGNNFPGGSDFSDINVLHDGTNAPLVLNAERDVINNVENVYINGPLGSRYAVSVVGRRVNVNAVTSQTNGIKQDYALVISSGNLLLTNALTLTNELVTFDPSPFVVGMTNTDAGDIGERVSFSMLEGERVGANYPLETGTNGTRTQWNFYRFTNTFGFSNLAFATFASADMSGVASREYPVPTLRNVDADIDLYVSTTNALLNLDPVVIDTQTAKSVGRHGDELVFFTNAPPISNHVYYIGIKSEDQRAAEFNLFAIASEAPFADIDGNDIKPRFFPRPALIPDGSPSDPGQVQVIGFVPPLGNGKVRRIVVTNVLDHQNFGDLVGVIHKQGLSQFSILNNHTFPIPDPDPTSGTNVLNIYNDLDEGDTPGAIPSDGPGKLSRFMGEQAGGMWFYTVADSALSHTGRVVNFILHVERQPETGGSTTETEVVSGTTCKPIYGGSQRYDAVEVPPGTTNLTVFVDDPTIQIFLRRGEIPTLTQFDEMGSGGSVSLSINDVPPLMPDMYYIMLYNPGATIDSVCWFTRLQLTAGDTFVTYRPGNQSPLLDDAVTNSTIFVTNDAIVARVQVGVRIDHPRVSDLSLRLLSPSGTGVLLFENRGGLTPYGIGTNTALFTNQISVWSSGFELPPPGFYPALNVVDNWNVSANNVRVVNDAQLNGATSDTGDQLLALNYGTMSQVLPTTNGGSYTLEFAYRRPPIRDPISWWKGETNTDDSMPNFNHGTILGAGVGYTPGYVDSALAFDGAGDSGVVVPQDLSLNVNEFSVETWIYPTNVNDPRPIVEWADATGPAGVHIWYGMDDTGAASPGRVYVNVRTTGPADNIVVTPANILPANQWSHIAVTKKVNGLTRIWVNGVMEANVNIGNGLIPVTDLPLNIGLRPTGSSEPNYAGTNHWGLIDELSVFNFELGPGEVRDIYDAGMLGKCGALSTPSICNGTNTVEISGVLTNTLAPTTTWQKFSTNFVATSNGTPLTLQGISLVSWVDSFNLLEEQADSGIYGVFTEDLRYGPELIKFAQPPFGSAGFTNNSILSNSFELEIPTNYTVGKTIETWTVTSDSVSVITETNFAHTGTNVLSLNSVAGTTNGTLGAISTNLPTVPGRKYAISFAYREPHSSLTNWWTGDSNTNDFIGGEDATLFNGATYTNGVVDSAFFFDGIDDYAEASYNGGNFGTGDFTVDFWIQSTQVNKASYIISKRTACGAGNFWNVLLGQNGLGDGSIQVELMNTTGPVLYNNFYTAQKVNDGIPHHVAVVRSGTMVSIYVDGQLSTNQATASVIDVSNAAPVRFGTSPCVGNDGNLTTAFDGVLDEVGLHTRAISPSEIRSIYEARGAGRFDSLNPPVNAPNAQISITFDGQQSLASGDATWRIFTNNFVATSSNTVLTIAAVTNGMWIDTLNIGESRQNYYLPEESLSLFAGENAYGFWTLEVWDSRLGEAVGANLVSWQLQLSFAGTNMLISPTSPSPSPVVSLFNATPVNGSVPPGGISYFSVQVPNTVVAVTNSLLSLTGGALDLVFNQDALPMTAPGNWFLLRDTTGGSQVLTNGGLPSLVPGQRYYLGVVNKGTQTNDFTIRVDYEFTEPTIQVPFLENGVALSTNIAPGYAMQHFQIVVPTNAASATFEVLEPTGNVDLYVKSGAPLPTYSNYSYRSANGGTNEELIVVMPDSAPVPLGPGTWYVGVLNLDTDSVSYSVRATIVGGDTGTNIFTLTADTPVSTVMPPSGQLTNFYRFVISDSSPSALFEVYDLSGNADLLLRRGALPSFNEYDFSSANAGLLAEQIVISSSTLGDLNGEWFLAVPNNESFAVNYTIRATVSTNGLLLSGQPLRLLSSPEMAGGNIELTWNSVATENYEVQLSTNLVEWTPINTVTATSQVTVHSTPATNTPSFYRIKQVP